MGVEIPVVQEKIADNTVGSALPQVADTSGFWKRIKGLGGENRIGRRRWCLTRKSIVDESQHLYVAQFLALGLSQV